MYNILILVNTVLLVKNTRRLSGVTSSKDTTESFIVCVNVKLISIIIH